MTVTSVNVAEKAGRMLKELVPAIQTTAELVQIISIASNEQKDSAEQINRAIRQLVEVIQENSSASEEVAATAAELAAQAEQLQAAIGFFRVNQMKSEAMPQIPERVNYLTPDSISGVIPERDSSHSPTGRTDRRRKEHLFLAAG